MNLMGTCSSCGARCMATHGSATGPAASRGEAIAAVAVTGRRLAYVIEGKAPHPRRDTEKLICRECVIAAVAEGSR